MKKKKIHDKKKKKRKKKGKMKNGKNTEMEWKWKQKQTCPNSAVILPANLKLYLYSWRLACLHSSADMRIM